MGGRFSRRRTNQIDPNAYNDPFYQGGGLPPTGAQNPYSNAGGYGAYGGLGGYDPDPYGYGYYETDPFETYGGQQMGRGRNAYGGRYGGGFSQMPGMTPWSYGNFYMGNTTMHMIPYMKRKVAKFEQRQGMGGGIGGGMMPMMPMMPCAQPVCGMPMMPCAQPACSMPMAAPMMAIAAPLPIAYNPLIQGMYPMVTANTANWMTPSSFMSALSTGPMPYRPPPSFELPNNIGMVMTVPYGASNPLLTPSGFGGFNPQFSMSGGFSCCCCYCAPAPPPPPPPAITYYPRPVCVPQPYPVPCPAPVAIPNIQQVPVPRPVTVVAPPIIAGCNQSFPIPSGAPLVPFQGGFTQSGFDPTVVMASKNSTVESISSDETPKNSKCDTSIPKSIDQTRRRKAQQIAASLSNLGLNNNISKETTSTRSKYRNKSYRTSYDFGSSMLLNGKNAFDSDWLTSDTLSDLLDKCKQTRHGKSTKRQSRTHRHRNSLTSDHNCVACTQELLDKFS